jgi:TolB protein
MTMITRRSSLAVIAVAAAVLASTFTPAVGVVTAVPLLAQAPDQQPVIQLGTISGNTGARRRIAVPDFSVPGGTAEVQQAAKTISQVLWDDLDFEGEFYMIPAADAAKIPAADTMETLRYDLWTELGVDAVVLGSVTSTPAGLSVRIQIVGVRGELARKQVFGKVYGGGGCSLRNPRYCAHYISDDFYKTQGVDGIARTRLAFSSDRNSEVVAGRVAQNAVQEIYISDYDGANPSRITVNRSLNNSPSWSPDGRSLAYTSYASKFPDIYIQNIFEVGRPVRPAGGTEDVQSAQSSWSPDGTRIAFASRRGAAKNYNIYVANRDGSNIRQLTQGDGGDVAPVWSPSGNQIVFASGRSGKPQLYLIGADGAGLTRLSCQESECDHPSWSAAVNKIAFTCGGGGGYDICAIDMGTRTIVKLTDGVGSNEQPSFAPNGRHVVFVTTRWGKKQLATVNVKGEVSKRRITPTGNNTYPDWSRAPR